MGERRAESSLDLRSPQAALVVVRAQLGDRAALERVLAALQEPLIAHIRALVRDDDLAGDVLQHVLLTVARKLDALRDPRWLRAWALRIATREGVRQAARAARQVDRSVDDEVLAALPAPIDEPLFDPELIEAVPRLVASLPPACQVVVRLRYLEELSVPEIAEALEIPEGTVKSRLAYGLSRIRELVSRTNANTAGTHANSSR